MKDIWTIFRKEALDVLRDKRTLMITVFMPMVLFPAIFLIVAAVSKNTYEKEAERELKVGYLAKAEDLGFREILEEETYNFEVVDIQDTSGLRQLVPDSLQAVFIVEDNFREDFLNRRSAKLTLLYDKTEDVQGNRFKAASGAFQEQLLAERLDTLGLDRENINPLEIQNVNIISTKETIGKVAGGFLPYFIIIFAFLGCMYVAIDLFAGEKERGSFETILTVPVDRWKILVGKMSVIVLMGMISTVLGFLGMFIGLQLIDTLPPQFMAVINSLLSPGFIATLLGLILLLSIALAGIMTPLSLRARSYKEAQSTISPLNIAVIIPAAIGMLPGIDLNFVTALIPVLNVTLCTKEVIAGTIDPVLLGVTTLSLFIFASLSVFISFKSFSNEKNILRG